MSRTAQSQAWFSRGQRVTPGGVNSPVRAFTSVGGTPRFITRGHGARIWDVDGNEYVDLVGAWGPALLGHAHPEVVTAVHAATDRGFGFGTPTTTEVELAEEMVARTPIDQVRLVTSGTEATMSAIRLARAATGRTLIIKFAGCYHGHVDSLLVQAGSGLATLSVPGTPGVPEPVAADTLVVPYNNPDAVRDAFAQHGSRVAALITEAAPGNMGVVPPAPGFNNLLRELTAAHGALFISDEVMTGFRVSARGQWGLDGAQEGWQPDLMTFGKVMGGGLPAAAFGGRADLMGLLAPAGPVYQAGTLSGNPLATTAGLATLRLADQAAYDTLNETVDRLTALITEQFTTHEIAHRIQRTGPLFSVFFTDHDVVDFAGATVQDTGAFAVFFQALLAQGVHLPPSAFEAWFVSVAHGAAELEKIAAALPTAARAVVAYQAKQGVSQ